MSFNNHRFTGRVDVPSNLQALSMRNNELSDIIFPATLHRLELVDMRNNALSGAVSAALARADSLIALHLSDNQLTEVPRDWPRASGAIIRLHVFDIDNNRVQARPRLARWHVERQSHVMCHQ